MVDTAAAAAASSCLSSEGHGMACPMRLHLQSMHAHWSKCKTHMVCAERAPISIAGSNLSSAVFGWYSQVSQVESALWVSYGSFRGVGLFVLTICCNGNWKWLALRPDRADVCVVLTQYYRMIDGSVCHDAGRHQCVTKVEHVKVLLLFQKVGCDGKCHLQRWLIGQSCQQYQVI